METCIGRNLVLATVLLLSAGQAFPQTQAPVAQQQQQQPPAGAAGALGPVKPNPELKQARRAMRQACAEDIRTLCAGFVPGGGKIMMCLRSSGEQVSDGCKAAARHLRDLRRRA